MYRRDSEFQSCIMVIVKLSFFIVGSDFLLGISKYLGASIGILKSDLGKL